MSDYRRYKQSNAVERKSTKEDVHLEVDQNNADRLDRGKTGPCGQGS